MEKTEERLLSEIEKISLKLRRDFDHFALDYEELIQSFHKYISKLIQYNPIHLYDNPLSLLAKDGLGKEISKQFSMELKKYESDFNYSRRFHKIVKYYKDCIKDGYAITDEEFYELYRLMLIDKENEETYIKYLISQVIEGNNKIDEWTYQVLLEKFVKSVIKKNKLNVCFRIGELEDSTDDAIAETIYRYGVYYVTYDSKKLNLDCVLEDLEFMFHEIRHTVQDSGDYSEANLIEMFKKDDYIRRIFGEEYYDDNYGTMSYEVDADLHAVMMLADLLKEISPATYETNRELLENKLKEVMIYFIIEREYLGEKNMISMYCLIEQGVSVIKLVKMYLAVAKVKKYLKVINI